MAYQPTPGARRPRNPHTQAQIRRDVWLQIVAPLVLATVVLIVLVVLIIAPVGAPIRRPLADVSLTIIKHTAGEASLRRLTPLSGLQEDSLQRLG